MNDWNDAEQQVEKAQELFEQQKWSEALELLRAAVSINPYNSAWLFNIGLTMRWSGLAKRSKLTSNRWCFNRMIWRR
jgi:hypothetical protein